MKICFPIVSDQGMDSLISDHFGSAPAFLIVDTASGESTATTNGNLQHAHGTCNPLKELAPFAVEAIAVRSIGGGALHGLTRSGLKLYRSDGATVADNLARLAQEGLPELSADQVCGGHGHGHGCGQH
jgi:predicted Fe-Mo cluster-binding NifX family protein